MRMSDVFSSLSPQYRGLQSRARGTRSRFLVLFGALILVALGPAAANSPDLAGHAKSSTNTAAANATAVFDLGNGAEGGGDTTLGKGRGVGGGSDCEGNGNEWGWAKL